MGQLAVNRPAEPTGSFTAVAKPVSKRSAVAIGRRGMLSGEMAANPITARRWFVRGRVQGVGYRYFAQRAAVTLGLTGYARNLDDGRVEVYAVGSGAALDELAGMLHRGPRWSDVRGVEEMEAPVRAVGEFRVE